MINKAMTAREELLRQQHSEDRLWDIERKARVWNAEHCPELVSEEYMKLFYAEDKKIIAASL